MKETEKLVALHIKIPASVKAKIRELSAADRRSISGWITVMVESEVKRREKKP